MARLVIIITFEGDGDYIIWGKVNDWTKGKVGSVCTRCQQFNDDLAVIFCHPSGSEIEQREQTTRMVTEITKRFADFNEVYIAAHQGRVNWSTVRMELRDCLKGAADFDHFGETRGRDKVYDAILDLVSDPSNEKFNAVVEEIKKKHPLDFLRRLSILKHRLTHLFLPIDIDLQGLIETNFKQEYWDEVVEAWKGGKALDMLRQARELLYGQGEADSVAKVVEDAKAAATDDRKKEKIENAWKKVKEFLPESSEQTGKYLPNEHAEAEEILRCLGCRNMREYVREKCQSKPNPFHKWFAALNEALDELREAI